MRARFNSSELLGGIPRLLAALLGALLLTPFPIRPLERLSTRLVLGNDVVEGLPFDGSLFTDLSCPQAPDDVRCEDAHFKQTAGGPYISPVGIRLRDIAYQRMYTTPPMTSKVFCATDIRTHR